VFFTKLPTVKFTQDTAYLAITYWKKVHSCWGTQEGRILNVRHSDGFGTLI